MKRDKKMMYKPAVYNNTIIPHLTLPVFRFVIVNQYFTFFSFDKNLFDGSGKIVASPTKIFF